MIYEVADGRLVDVGGNKNHFLTTVGLRVELKDFADHHHNPDRPMYPLRRVGPKVSEPNKIKRNYMERAVSETGQRIPLEFTPSAR